MGKILAVLGGLIAMIGSVVLLILSQSWWWSFKVLVKGFIPPIVFFGGLIALIAGLSSFKDAARAKKLEAELKEDEKKAAPKA
jgi:ABC-type antimicrobial peptide transport system permease subunit